MPDPDACGWPIRSRRPPARRGRGAHRAGAARRRGAAIRGASLQREVHVPVRRLHGRRARAAQLRSTHRTAPARRAPASDAARDRPGPRHPGPPRASHQGASCRGPGCPTTLWRLRSSRRSAGRTAGTSSADPRPPAGRVEYILRAKGREGPRPLPARARREHLQGEVRGRHHQPGAALPGNRLDYVKAELEKYMVTRPCPTCRGKRLRPEILAVTVGGKSITDIAALSITDALGGSRASGDPSERERTIAHQILKEIVARLGFLVDVGLDYLTLDRTSVTLSGGEAQRIRLATQIGSTLMGVLYILDEPSIGLHQRDNAKLIATLTRLRDLGNTVLVVEHDEETIRTADWSSTSAPARRARRRDHRLGTLEEVWPSPVDHRRIPVASAPSDPGDAPAGQRQDAHREGCAREQPQVVDLDPARHVRRGHRRVGQRQEHARHGGSVQGAGARAQRLARAGRRPRRARAPSTSTRSSTSTSARSAARRARTRPPTPACSRRSASCSPRYRRRVSAATSPDASPSTSRAAAARPARATASSRSRCSSCRTSTSLRGLQGEALQPRGARDPLQGQDHLRRPGDDGRRGARVLRRRPERPGEAADAVRRRPRLHPPGPARDDAVGRRSAARQAFDRAVAARDRPDALRPRRADDGLHFADVGKLLEVLTGWSTAATRSS